MASDPNTLEGFTNLHKAQLTRAQLPEHLWKQVHAKLYGAEEPVYDADEAFALQYVEDEGFRLVAKKEMKKEGDVFLLDHCWTTTGEYAREQLRRVDGLLDRVWTIADCERRLKEELREKKRQAIVAARAKAQEEAEAKAKELRKRAEEKRKAETLATAENVAVLSAHVPAAVARRLLVEHNGDLIHATQAAESLAGKPEELKAFEAAEGKRQEEDKTVYADLAAAEEALAKLTVTEASTEEGKKEEEEEEVELPSIDEEAKIEYALLCLVKAGLLGTYFVARKKEAKAAAALKQDDVDTVVYLNDEIGSAVRISEAPNARLEPLVLVSVGGELPVAFSMLWLTQDVPEEGVITRPNKPVPIPTALLNPTASR